MMAMGLAAALFVWLVGAVMLAITRVGDESVVLVESLVLFAPLVVVPVGLPLARPIADDAGASPYALARRLWPVGALGAAAGMVVPEGPLAALFVLPWLFVTSLLASHGLRRLLRGPRTAPELAVSAALLYVPVGAVWLGAYRLGLPLFGFGGVKALLTASHFHYAGFGACLVAGRLFVGDGGGSARRRVDAPWARTLHRAATLGLIAGIALLAAGITASRPLEIAAAWLLVACVGSLGLLLALRATEPGVDAVTRALLAVSALSTVVSMSFAAAFTMTGFAKLEAVTLHRMATYHGAVNALGFVACGLFGLARLAERSGASRVPGGFGGRSPPSSRLVVARRPGRPARRRRRDRAGMRQRRERRLRSGVQRRLRRREGRRDPDRRKRVRRRAVLARRRR